MKASQLLGVCIGVGFAATAVACGGDDESAGGTGGAASGGSSATGGAAIGGSSATGGSSASGGTGGTSSGGTSSGGSASGGTGGAGGGGPDANSFNCSPASGDAPALKLTLVDDGLNLPVYVTHAPGDENRLFVIEVLGKIRVIENGELLSTPFLDIEELTARDTNNQNDERGLLGLAFHPNYQENGRFFVHYTASSQVPDTDEGDTVIAEYKVSSDPNLADASSEKILLTEFQPGTNHNGATIAFGPDGYLYIALGDGGGPGASGNAQDLSSLKGSILRIDVDSPPTGEKKYAIPPGNLPDAAPEVWAYGLRNPYRFSFDGCTGDLYIGDVGENSWEEINVTPALEGHQNFGWPIYEGTMCSSGCDIENTLPVTEYGHDMGQAVTGGTVYRGSAIPGLRGTYFYADVYSGETWAFEYTDGEAANVRSITDDLNPEHHGITSFGLDYNGEVYVTSYFDGAVYRIDAE